MWFRKTFETTFEVGIFSGCVAVVCMIVTIPSNWMTKARAVLNTWAKRCHIPLFFYSRSAAKRGDPIINAKHTVALDVPEGRGHLTGKTMAALRYSLATYGHVADWFLKCDDDTLAICDSVSLWYFSVTRRIYLYEMQPKTVRRHAGHMLYVNKLRASYTVIHENARSSGRCG